MVPITSKIASTSAENTGSARSVSRTASAICPDLLIYVTVGIGMVPQTEAAEQTPGRPRDARIDEAVLGATRELLLEVGWTGISLTSIAERAGTTRPALARRWPSLAHLVHEAAFPQELAAPVTG